MAAARRARLQTSEDTFVETKKERAQVTIKSSCLSGLYTEPVALMDTEELESMIDYTVFINDNDVSIVDKSKCIFTVTLNRFEGPLLQYVILPVSPISIALITEGKQGSPIGRADLVIAIRAASTVKGDY
jgi:hypothetical protein